MSDKRAKAGDVERQIIARVLKDPQFRAQLIADPKAAIAQATGVRLPEHVKVQVIEQKPGTVYLILPRAGAEGELSEAELAEVAGGRGFHPDPNYFGNLPS